MTPAQLNRINCHFWRRVSYDSNARPHIPPPPQSRFFDTRNTALIGLDERGWWQRAERQTKPIRRR